MPVIRVTTDQNEVWKLKPTTPESASATKYTNKESGMKDFGIENEENFLKREIPNTIPKIEDANTRLTNLIDVPPYKKVCKLINGNNAKNRYIPYSAHFQKKECFLRLLVEPDIDAL